jgi:hypothetical protein
LTKIDGDPVPYKCNALLLQSQAKGSLCTTDADCNVSAGECCTFWNDNNALKSSVYTC